MPIAQIGNDMTQMLTCPTQAAAEPEPFVIKFKPLTEMTDAQFAEFCTLNDILRVERTSKGEIILMPPAFTYTSKQNIKISSQLDIWAESDGTCIAYESSAGFNLPNGALRSPDASWVLISKLRELTSDEGSGFYSVCPDFVIELRSTSDSISMLQEKMHEYIENGARLGWLIDPISTPKRVHIYRPQSEVEVLDEPSEISADPELSGFTLKLSRIWEPPF